MGSLPFAFMSPALLGALVVLPAIWWLLKLTPPRPQREIFPPLKILARVLKREETPAQSPWWLTALRMLMATLIILALADPVLNPQENRIAATGPLALVIDNSWASVADWDQRMTAARTLVDEAEAANQPISLVLTANPDQDAAPQDAATIRERLQAAEPRPLVAERARAITALAAALKGRTPGTVAFITDGIAGPAGTDKESALASLSALKPADLRLIEDDGKAAIAITGADNDAESMTVSLTRLAATTPRQVTVNAFDRQGRILASAPADFAAGSANTTARLTVPYELRNDFARLSLTGIETAGAVHLLDDSFRRRKVALIAGEAGNEFQPLLAPLYYLDRALKPYADLIRSRDNDMAKAIPDLLQQNPSVLIMADVGRLPQETVAAIDRFVKKGGMLIRFAGPHLAASPADDPLLPVPLRQGERELGGALSWSEPQPLAPFPASSPFAGLPTPKDVRVKRQVLAEPTPDLREHTWASLADGTPLVTARDVGAGRIVLFHVTAETSWSNLPLSGDFVAMLRRVVQMSHAGPALKEGEQAASLPPYRLLNAMGQLTAETGMARPLDQGPNRLTAARFDHPPGLYGAQDGFVALNLLPKGAELKPLDQATSLPLTRISLSAKTARPLKPMLLMLAVLLFLADCLAVLVIHGAFARLPKRTAAVLLLTLAGLAAVSLMPASQALANDAKPGDDVLLKRLDTTHLAYVITGEPAVDAISKSGLEGLSQYLTYHTALEPGAPVGVDISKDELSIFPILFWPISATAPMPSEAAISRIDAYMRAGGTVLFDTRDQLTSLGTDGGVTANGARLRQILANIDIPPLEPVPKNHVLTRTFFLLQSFPGRYDGSPLWVEARPDKNGTKAGLASSGDGVSPIIITGNDLMGAWAVNDQGMPLMPTVPPDDRQREMAYRVGVNIMMYMFTGNYKADQVHVPALLERLGQ
ncbi:DUF4159 domain-containing protein [Allorhizobium sp. BGMRC 0089]|uniref:DUF4159 domain-containing protein n=1 Tax=Allorhizobium sonneratiae TaxID=2934936 RepID=UPI0020334B61|nr:DUF4159 domain-containing protein [Allorhizobium sonneratiae]MCM2291194.1 DUF4159 domain-containing protein [Allorhizobium sonneratiae]